MSGILGMFEKGGEWLGRGAHIAEWAHHAGQAAGPLGELAHMMPAGLSKALPGVGIAAGAISGGINLGEAVHNFQEEGYHSDKAWNNVGGTILGGANIGLAAGGPATAPYGAALAAGEIAGDALGAGAGWAFGDKAGFSANNMVGGLARGMFGDRSWGESLSNTLGGGVGGHIAGTALNVLASPLQLGATIGSGIANEVGSIGSAIWNGEGAVGGAIHSIGSGIGSVASSVGSGIGSAASAVGGGLASAGSAILSFLSDRRMKRDIAPMSNALAFVSRL